MWPCMHISKSQAKELSREKRSKKTDYKYFSCLSNIAVNQFFLYIFDNNYEQTKEPRKLFSLI